MNDYMQAQIDNIKVIVKTFEQNCRMAALKNDGTIDRDEDRQLKKISAACAGFIKDLDKIR